MTCSKAGKEDRTDQNIKQKNSDYRVENGLRVYKTGGQETIWHVDKVMKKYV